MYLINQGKEDINTTYYIQPAAGKYCAFSPSSMFARVCIYICIIIDNQLSAFIFTT